jgi:hypothetical protein
MYDLTEDPERNRKHFRKTGEQKAGWRTFRKTQKTYSGKGWVGHSIKKNHRITANLKVELSDDFVISFKNYSSPGFKCLSRNVKNPLIIYYLLT